MEAINIPVSTFRTTATGSTTLKESILASSSWLELDPTNNKPIYLECYKNIFSSDQLYLGLQEAALRLFEQKSPEEKAALPIYDNPCSEYLEIIETGVREVCKSEGLNENSRWHNFDSIKLRENNGRIYVNLLRLSQQVESASSREELSHLAIVGAQGMIEHSWQAGALDLSGQNLSGLNWMIHFSNFIFVGADMRNFTVENKNMSDTNFERADLTGAKFYRTDLSRANFCGSILTDTQFIECNMDGVKMNADANTNKEF